MVDAATLTLLATVAQTIVITVMLLVFILQFRSQEQAVDESSYQNLMGRYNDLVMMEAARERPSSLYMSRLSRRSGRSAQITVEQAEAFSVLLVIYGLLVEAFTLYKKKWIDKETWDQWAAWLSDMAEDPDFRSIHETSQGMFDPGFEAYLAKGIAEKKQKKISSKKEPPSSEK